MSLLVLAWAVYEGRWPTTIFALSPILVTSGSILLVMEAGDEAYAAVFESLDGE